MKTGIHPQYFEASQIRCSCGNIIVTGSTKESMRTELCSKCHPFYTGQQRIVDTAGRVDRFREKVKTAERKQAAAIEAKIAKKTKKPVEKPVVAKKKTARHEAKRVSLSKK